MSCSEKILTGSETLSYVSKMIISSSARVLRLNSPFFFFFPILHNSVLRGSSPTAVTF